MSVNSEVQNVTDDDDIQKQGWFFTLLSESQAETILNAGSSGNRFLVSKLSSSKDYRISIRRTKQAAEEIEATGDVEHIIISYDEENQSYGIERQSQCQSVVEVVRNYVASCDYALEPFAGSLEVNKADASPKPVPTSTESTQIEETPPYNAEMQHTTDEQPLPQIEINLDPEKVKEGRTGSTSSADNTGSSHAHEHEHGCCWGACGNWYELKHVGRLRRICSCLMYIILYLFIGLFCGSCIITGLIIFCCCFGLDCCHNSYNRAFCKACCSESLVDSWERRAIADY